MTGTATLRSESEIEKKIGEIESDISRYISFENKFLAEGRIFNLKAFMAENLKAVYPTPASIDKAHIQHVEAVREKLILKKLAEAKRLADCGDMRYNSKLQDMKNIITTSFKDYAHKTNYVWAIDAGKKIEHQFKSQKFEENYDRLYNEIFHRILCLDRSDAINLHEQVVGLNACVSEFGDLVKPNYHPCAQDFVLAEHIEAVRGDVLTTLLRGAVSLAESGKQAFKESIEQADFVAFAEIAYGKPDKPKYNSWIAVTNKNTEKKYDAALAGKPVTGAASSL